MAFRDPITTLPFSALTGQVDPTTQIAPGTLAAGILLPSAQLQGLVPTTQLSGQVTTGQISANAIGTNQLAANAVTAGILAATAVDGKTVTGATIRTAANGKRVEINATYQDEVLFYSGNAAEQAPAFLQVNSNGDLTIASADTTTPVGTNAYIQLRSNVDGLGIAYGAAGGHAFTGDGPFTVNGHDQGETTLYDGTGVTQTGISGAFAVNTVNVPAAPFPTLHVVTIANVLTQTLAGDTFLTTLRQGTTDTMGVLSGGSTLTLSTPPMTRTFTVAANTALTYQTVVSRYSGSGTASSSANGVLNTLRVAVHRAGA